MNRTRYNQEVSVRMYFTYITIHGARRYVTGATLEHVRAKVARRIQSSVRKIIGWVVSVIAFYPVGILLNIYDWGTPLRWLILIVVIVGLTLTFDPIKQITLIHKWRKAPIAFAFPMMLSRD